MKTAAYLIMLLAILSCRKQKDILPQQAKMLVGKWEQIAVLNRNSEWIDTPTDGLPALIVRSDGVFLDRDGKAMCCVPEKLIINGVSFKVAPTSPVPYNEVCNRVYCILCEVAKFQVNKDEMTQSRCGNQTRYRRLP